MGNGRVASRIERTPPADLAISAITAYELEVGTLGSKYVKERRAALERLFDALSVLPFDSRAANHAARVRFSLQKAGTNIGPLDTLIAATVLAYGATLVTHNQNEFSRVPGLQLEDWY